MILKFKKSIFFISFPYYFIHLNCRILIMKKINKLFLMFKWLCKTNWNNNKKKERESTKKKSN